MSSDRPVLVTTAPQSPKDELRGRQRRYLITMGVRVLCFIGAVWLVSAGLRWEAVVAVAASLVLPWVAVVAANAGPKRELQHPSLYDGAAEARRLDRGPS